MDDKLAEMLIVASKNLTEKLEEFHQTQPNHGEFTARAREVKEAARYATGVMDTVATLLLEENPFEAPEKLGEVEALLDELVVKPAAYGR